LVLPAILAAPASGAEAPAGGSLQQNQIMRQQQQDTLQLQMLQQQRSLQSPPVGARQRQEQEQLEINQRQRQQELQYRQGTEPATVRPDDDAGAQRARAERNRLDAKEEGATQLRRFDYELKRGAESRSTEKARGEVRPPEPPALLKDQ
jgi:hypothetical protein